MAPVIPKDIEEAERLDYKRATPEEVEARKALDMKSFSERRGTSDLDSALGGLADCSKPGNEGKRCYVSNCIDGYIFAYMCESNICMKLAYKIQC